MRNRPQIRLSAIDWVFAFKIKPSQNSEQVVIAWCSQWFVNELFCCPARRATGQESGPLNRKWNFARSSTSVEIHPVRIGLYWQTNSRDRLMLLCHTRSSPQWWSGRSVTTHIMFDLRSLSWGFGQSWRHKFRARKCLSKRALLTFSSFERETFRSPG